MDDPTNNLNFFTIFAEYKLQLIVSILILVTYFFGRKIKEVLQKYTFRSKYSGYAGKYYAYEYMLIDDDKNSRILDREVVIKTRFFLKPTVKLNYHEYVYKGYMTILDDTIYFDLYGINHKEKNNLCI